MIENSNPSPGPPGAGQGRAAALRIRGEAHLVVHHHVQGPADVKVLHLRGGLVQRSRGDQNPGASHVTLHFSPKTILNIKTHLERETIGKCPYNNGTAVASPSGTTFRTTTELLADATPSSLDHIAHFVIYVSQALSARRFKKQVQPVFFFHYEITNVEVRKGVRP